jgi:type IV secretion system protein VirB1
MSTALATLIGVCAPLVHPLTMHALIRVESAGNPYAISVNAVRALRQTGLKVPDIDPQPTGARDALARSRWLLAHGYTVSVGLAQINSIHVSLLQRLGVASSLADLFDPCTNLRAAQHVLLQCWTGSGAGNLTRTLSCYNSGSPTIGVANGYVARVTRAASCLIGSQPGAHSSSRCDLQNVAHASP